MQRRQWLIAMCVLPAAAFAARIRLPADAGDGPALADETGPSPDYLVCLECETPCYTFEWENGRVTEAVCGACGNDDPEQFALPEDLEDAEGA